MAEQHNQGDVELARRRAGALAPEDPLTTDHGEVDGPVDLMAVRADDMLLDSLSAAHLDANRSIGDQELSALLLSWRRDVDAEPIGDLVDLDTALATIEAAKTQSRRRHRFLIPLATAAAVLAIGFTGVGLAARSAEPGDTLWGLTRVLYADHARSVEAAASVRADLDIATNALRQGRPDIAKAALDRAAAALAAVAAEDGKDTLAQQHDTLKEQVGEPPNPGTGNPTPVQPPPVVVATTTSKSEPPPPPSPTTTTPPSTTTVPTSTTPPSSTTSTSPSEAPTGSGGNSSSGGGRSTENNPPPPPPPPPPATAPQTVQETPAAVDN
ncbi:anti-sigma-D factor RsdA [Crossiella sp. CA198]|uniref:anti-sigma-D factor RsdA n=1 Tax=Crossiella sp. CA198 TaxID=3455607 RepID=UPI003F8D4BE0